MNHIKFPSGNILSLLVMLQLFALQLRAQSELLKPEKMDENTYTRFEDIIKYNNPDSLIYYRPGRDSQAYMKFNYRYNAQHQPVVEDEYEIHNQRYRLVHRTVKTYDPRTNILRQKDVRIINKVLKDSFSTRTENIFKYDLIGNLVSHIAMDTLNGVSVRANGDSLIYQYDNNGVPLFERTYFFGIIGSAWIPDKINKAEGVGADGNPKVITLSVVNTDWEVIPTRQYKSISWAKHCNSLEGIDTLAKEYTVALFYDGKWVDSYKKINAFNARGRVDSSIVYTFKNDSPQPNKKDVLTYKGGLDFKSKLHYEYLYGHWQLTAGTRRTLSFGNDGNNHYYLDVKEEVYEIPHGASSGNWKEQNNIVVK